MRRSEADWLRHLDGYRVDTPDGPVGFVETVIFSDEGEPEAIEVRTGRFHTRLVSVALAEIDEIMPKWEVLVLRSVPR